MSFPSPLPRISSTTDSYALSRAQTGAKFAREGAMPSVGGKEGNSKGRGQRNTHHCTALLPVWSGIGEAGWGLERAYLPSIGLIGEYS